MCLSLECLFFFNKMTSYKCSKCDFSRGIKGYVTQHIKKTVKCNGAELIVNIVKVTCEVCNKKFDNDELLKIHKKVCVEKKALIKIHYQNPEEMNNKIDILIELVNTINNKCETLKEENKQLRNRINIIEKRGPKSKKAIAEDLEEEEDEDALCEYNKPIKFIPMTYENTKFYLKDCHCEDFSNVKMTIRGQRDYIVEGSVEETCIIIGDVEYSYEPKSGKKLKGRKYTDDLKIEIVKYCYCEKLKGENFCVKHLE